MVFVPGSFYILRVFRSQTKSASWNRKSRRRSRRTHNYIEYKIHNNFIHFIFSMFLYIIIWWGNSGDWGRWWSFTVIPTRFSLLCLFCAGFFFSFDFLLSVLVLKLIPICSGGKTTPISEEVYLYAAKVHSTHHTGDAHFPSMVAIWCEWLWEKIHLVATTCTLHTLIKTE